MIAFIVAIVGVIAIFYGRFGLHWRWIVEGKYARIAGFLLLLPMLVNFSWRILTADDTYSTYLVIDILSSVAGLMVASIVASSTPPQAISTTQLIEVSRAAYLANVPQDRIISLIETGLLPGTKIGQTYYVESKVLDLWITFENGKAKLETGDYQAAINYFTNVINWDTKDASIYLLRAEAFYKNNDLARAKFDFDKAKKLAAVDICAATINEYLDNKADQDELLPAFTGFQRRDRGTQSIAPNLSQALWHPLTLVTVGIPFATIGLIVVVASASRAKVVNVVALLTTPTITSTPTMPPTATSTRTLYPTSTPTSTITAVPLKGRLLALSSTHTLYWLALDVNDVTPLFPDLRCESVSLSHDGRMIACRGKNQDNKHTSLIIGNIESGDVHSIPETGDADYNPRWSPDNKQLVFARELQTPYGRARHIYLINLDGTHLRRVTQSTFFSTPTPFPTKTPMPPGSMNNYPTDIPSTPLPTNNIVNDEPDWSPNGQSIVFTLYMGIDNSGLRIKALIYTINVDGSGLRRLTDGPGSYNQPVWSPDGKRIAFSSNLSDIYDNRREIYVVDADGTNIYQVSHISPGTALQASWSPDGRYLAFIAEDSYSRLYIAHVDGFSQRQLAFRTPDSYPIYLAWKPQ